MKSSLDVQQLPGSNYQSKDLFGGNEELDGLVVEVIPRAFAPEVGKDHRDFGIPMMALGSNQT